jgi:hypothetical protein
VRVTHVHADVFVPCFANRAAIICGHPVVPDKPELWPTSTITTGCKKRVVLLGVHHQRGCAVLAVFGSCLTCPMDRVIRAPCLCCRAADLLNVHAVCGAHSPAERVDVPHRFIDARILLCLAGSGDPRTE